MSILALVGSVFHVTILVLILLSLVPHYGWMISLTSLLSNLVWSNLLDFYNIFALVFFARAKVAWNDNHVVESGRWLELIVNFLLVIVAGLGMSLRRNKA